MPLISLRLADSWRNRRPYERWLIGLPVAALLVAALQIGIVEPLQQASARLRASLPGLDARRDRIKAEIASLAAPAQSAQLPALDRAALDAALARHGVQGAGATIDTTTDGRVRLALPNAPFFALWPLLQTLQSGHGARVAALRVDRLDATNARVEVVFAPAGR